MLFLLLKAMNDDYMKTEWNKLTFMRCGMKASAMPICGGQHSALNRGMGCGYDQNGEELTANLGEALQRTDEQLLRTRIPKPVWRSAKKYIN